MRLVVPPDPAWPARFAAEAERLRPILATVHHIGSTAVPGLAAKPTIDILGTVAADAGVASAVPALERLGYEARGAQGIAGRMFLRLMAGDRRLVHLHVHADGARHVRRHLAFRDWLRAHPAEAAAYGAHKLALAARSGTTRADYVADKDAFVRAAEARALAWDDAGRPGQDSHRLRRR